MSLLSPTRRRRAAVTTVTLVVLALLSGCSAETETQLRRLANPETASEQAPAMHSLWMWSWLAAAITGVLVWGLIFYACFKFRRRSENEIPVQTRYNLPIEILYTVAPLMMVIVLFKFTLDTQNEVLDPDETRTVDEVVTVVGQQWSWTFNYNLGYDEVEQKYETEGTGETVYEVGTTAEPPTLYLVKDKTVEINLFSPDVGHSFWVPAFLFKMDVIPGRPNHFTVTPDKEGTFVGRCAELCGTRHTRMLFNVKIVDQAEYDAHLADLAEQGNTGPALGGEDSESAPGVDEGNATEGAEE